jgi:hypothetical protein
MTQRVTVAMVGLILVVGAALAPVSARPCSRKACNVVRLCRGSRRCAKTILRACRGGYCLCAGDAPPPDPASGVGNACTIVDGAIVSPPCPPPLICRDVCCSTPRSLACSVDTATGICEMP